MVKKTGGIEVANRSDSTGADESARIYKIASRGVKMTEDVQDFMAAMMCDLAEGLVDARTAGAICNSAGKLMQAATMQYKYAPRGKNGKPKPLQLTSGR